MPLGQRLEQRRLILKLSRETVAARSEIDDRSIYNYERGKRSPTVRDLQKLASALDTTMSWLLEEPFSLEDEPNEEEIANRVAQLIHRPDIKEAGVLRIISRVIELVTKESTLFTRR